MNERELFLSALEIEDPAARQEHLQSACAEDADLLARVELLLTSHESQSQFLNSPVVQQLADDLDGGIDATIFVGNSLTFGDEPDVIFNANEPDPMTENRDDPAEEIPLGFLLPSERPDSLGRLGHYEILEVIGRGAFGTVLNAFDEKLERVVAIKVLALEMAAASPARKRFLREARSAASVRHDNVVRIYAVEDEPIPYLVMEYVPGQTLQQRLDERGPLELTDVLRLGKQIADGLAAAHAQQLIHRDVKPGNILLETSIDDHVKITDFGLARTADDASMTQSGMIAGTPLYMAPEQALGHELDQRADLFSFGSVLYQMLSGRPPFRASSTVAVLKRVADDAPRPIKEIIPEVPEWMCQLIGHLHAKNPDERYGSAKEVSDLLAKCLADVQEGREPKIPAPSRPDNDSAGEDVKKVRLRDAKQVFQRPLAKVAATVLVLFIALGITEATGVTKMASTVIRLATGSGTLVIETDDPDVKIAIDGEEVTIRGGGIEELTLRPGKYNIAATKDGKPLRQELVTITRNGRIVVRMRLESTGTVAKPVISKPPLSKPSKWPVPDRAAAEWVLGIGGTLNTDAGNFSDVAQLPQQPFRVVLVNLRGKGQVTDDDLEHLKGLTKLSTLILDGTQVSDTGLDHLKGLTGLTWLNLDNTQVTDEGLECLKALTNLEKLTLFRARQVNGTGLKHLNGLAKLSTLQLSGTQVSDTSLEFLKGMTQLVDVGLSDTEISDSGLKHLKGLAKLSELRLSDTEISDSGLEHLKGLRSLTTLILNNSQVTGEGLEYLKGLTNLTRLSLAFTQVSDTGLEHLKGLTNLKHLSFWGARQVTGTGLKHLVGLTNLIELHLHGTQVSDTSLKYLKGMTRLVEVTLSDTEISDSGLEHLKGLTRLDRINLNNSQVTTQGIADLQKALPNCKITGP